MKWFSGDERTLGLFLAVGVLVSTFTNLPLLRGYLGVGQAPEILLLVVTAIAWWSFLPRSFVWLDPADLTWRDPDRVTLIVRRLTVGWIARLLALGYVLALLAALFTATAQWVIAGTAVLVSTGLLSFAVVRRPQTVPRMEVLVVLAFAVVAMVRPNLFLLAAPLAAAGLVLFRPGTPPVAAVSRPALVDGWRDRVLRVSGVQFLDLALMLPAARPTRPVRLTSGLRLAWLGVLGRARHVPTAVLLGLTAVAGHRAFPDLPDVVVFTIAGYLAIVPLVAGLGELWRSPGRRRWVGVTDTAMRWHHVLVATLLGTVWGLPVWLGAGFVPDVLVTVPLLAACAVRTMTRKPPSYDNLMPVDTPFGKLPVRLIMQTSRGVDVGVLALVLMSGLPLWGAAVVVAATVAVAVFR